MIRFGEDICRDLPASSSCEWLETNGIGGYASSTVVGLNTRRYHGLLVAATKPPVGRMVLLSKLEEAVVVNGQRHELSTNRYPGTVHPEGYRLLREFRLDPFPVFVYEADSVEIKKQIFMVDGENTTVIEYEFRHLGQSTPSHCVFEVRPLIAFRDYHATTRRNDGLNPAVLMEAGTASIAPYPGLPTLYFAHNATLLEASGDWYYNFEYDVERERGLEDQEDLFSPFVARLDLSGTISAAFIVSTQRHDVKQIPALRMREMERRAELISKAASVDPLVRSLTTAADQFVVRRGERRTIIAGYHWFGDWGRDAMIALPGLTLSTGRPEIAREILLTFARHADRGMLPNRFPEAGERPEYNTVDATLWMFEAVRAYLEYTNDWEFLSDEMYGVLAGIIEWHQRGTRFGIRVDNDGLLGAGEPGVQLTWMDAKVGDLVVTPRRGKPVEIQALWYNALRVMGNLAGQRGDTEGERNYGELAEQVLVSFNDQFWDEQRGCLFDVVDGQVKAR